MNSPASSFELPFPPAISPYTEQLREHADAWAAASGMLDLTGPAKWANGRFERLVARMYPQAPLPRLRLICDGVLWLFLYDDFLGPDQGSDEQKRALECAGLTARILAGTEGTRPDPPTGALWDLRRALPEVCPAGWWPRWAADVQDFADSLHDEAVSRAKGVPGDVEAYLSLRRRTSGWAMLTDFVELAAGRVLPPPALASPACSALRWAAGDVACAINDLLSLRKELAAGEFHNLVLVLARARGCDTAQAVQAAESWIAVRLADYRRARGEFLADCARAGLTAAREPAPAAFVRGLESLMRGSLDWSLESARYSHTPGTTAAPVRSAGSERSGSSSDSGSSSGSGSSSDSGSAAGSSSDSGSSAGSDVIHHRERLRS